MFGLDSGASLFGILFHAIGTGNTLLIYAGMTSVILLVFLLYTNFSKKVNQYERLPKDRDEESIKEKYETISDNSIMENADKQF